MRTSRHQTPRARSVTQAVRRQIEAGGERAWRFNDFAEYPFQAVAQALSRLARQGELTRLGKGLYFRPRQTAFGPSLPNPSEIRALPVGGRGVFPAGVAAANLLGFTTQQPARVELATEASSLPTLIVGKEAVVHTRRPAAWRGLPEEDAALLDFLRNRGATSELGPEETVRKLLAHLSERGRFARLLEVAPSEPPRVRAMLGALAEELGKSAGVLRRLRASINPLSRFDFGALAALPHAGEWQAKEC